MKHDLCILNAGTMSGINCAHNISYLDFLEALKVNVIANKIIIDWSILNGCKFFIGISSGAALKNYDGWLNYCVSKSAFRSMLLQYQKDMTDLNFKLISPGILNTNMNKKLEESFRTNLINIKNKLVQSCNFSSDSSQTCIYIFVATINLLNILYDASTSG